MSDHAEQPMPVEGKRDVMPVLKIAFDLMCGERWKIGIERYGRPLQIDNGRDAGRDAMEELFDAMMYVQQGIMERKAIERKLALTINRLRDIQANLADPQQAPQVGRMVDDLLSVLIGHR